jgi:hypothetical protein
MTADVVNWEYRRRVVSRQRRYTCHLVVRPTAVLSQGLLDSSITWQWLGWPLRVRIHAFNDGWRGCDGGTRKLCDWSMALCVISTELDLPDT